MTKDNRTDPKANHGQHSGNQKPKRGKFSVIGFISVIACLFLLLLIASCKPVKSLVTTDNTGYHSLTTNCSAAKPSRHSLAIFVPKTCLTNYQQAINSMNKNTSALQASHKYSAATIGANIYDGLSEPNTIPLVGNKFRRLNTVVNDLSPYFFMGGKILTNCSGGYHA